MSNPTPIDAELVGSHTTEVPKRPEMFVDVVFAANPVIPKHVVVLKGEYVTFDIGSRTTFRLPAEGEKPRMPECVRELVKHSLSMHGAVYYSLDRAIDAVRAHYAEGKA